MLGVCSVPAVLVCDVTSLDFLIRMSFLSYVMGARNRENRKAYSEKNKLKLCIHCNFR
jgi:hypothetical protein